MKKAFLIMRPILIFILTIELLLRFIGSFYMYQLGRLYEDKPFDSMKIRILAVGESTTGGLWYEKDSYPKQLEKRLNDYYSCKSCADVQILSLPGANSSSTLRAYVHEISTLKPDLVIFMVGVNDAYYYAYNFDTLLMRKDFQDNKLLFTFDKILIRLSNESKLARLIKLAYTNLTVAKDKITDETFIYSGIGKVEQAKRDLFVNRHYEDTKITTRENIEKMIKITKSTPAIPILMTYHSADINEVIRLVANESETALIDNETRFISENNPSLISERDGWHPNVAGYKLITDNIFEYLVDHSLIHKESN